MLNTSVRFDPRQALHRRRLLATAGVHAGAVVELSAATVSVGSAPDNDVVLFGDQLAGHHYRLELKPGPFGGIVLHALGGDVLVDGGRTVRIGEYCDVRVGAALSAGTSTVIVENPIDRTGLILTGLKLGIAGLALTAVLIAWNIASGLANALPRMVDLDSLPGARKIEESIKSAVDNLSPAPVTPREAYVWTVRAKLEDLGLHRKVRALEAGDVAIRVTGAISDADVPAWNEFLRWYDTRVNAPKLVREVGRSSGQPDLPKLRSVWLDAKPIAIFENGLEVSVGEKLPGEWTVLEIAESGIVVERDGSRVNLTF